jgi:bifunctional UDP-N-acetylglucosamine pyrophosphorylase / glucosamine-1-phosphate N-acetyltransferase
MQRKDCTKSIQAIVLAAGKSTRFKTKKSKLLFTICGQPMILYPLRELEKLSIPVTLVLGHQKDIIKKEMERFKVKNCTFSLQKQQIGTGHAVASSQPFWEKDNILILNGDTPLLTQNILKSFIKNHYEQKASVSFCSSMVINPTGYGRVIQNDKHYKIVEEKNCAEKEKEVRCINAGIYIISKKFLEENINTIKQNSVTGEFYIVDLIKQACEQNLKVVHYSVPYDNVRGVNTLQELWSVEQIKRSEFIRHWMAKGVQFELAQSIHIDMNVTIGPGSFIGTGVHLLGNTKIGNECCVNAFSIVENTIIGNETKIHSHSIIQDSIIGKNAHIGPFARLRENVTIGDNAELGNFVEVKQTTVGNNSKAKHLTFLGDAKIGENVNIGAGTITCNFNGKEKNQTKIGDNSFIGSNNTLIAPLEVGEKAYTAGGSTITKNVPSKHFAIGRVEQITKENLNKKNKKKDTEKIFKAAIKAEQ